MTDVPAERYGCLRTVLAVVVLVDLIWLFFLLDEAREIGAATNALNPFNDLLSRTPLRVAVVSIGAGAAVAFGRAPGRLWAGLVALGASVLLNTAHAQLFGSPWRHLFFSGLCLSGWLLGLAVSRWRGSPSDESYARMGSLALLAAAYLNAGISKIVYGGVDWLSGISIQAVIVAQDGLVRDSVLTPYRAWVVETAWAAALFSVATLAFELGAPLMLAGARLRACIALGLVAMHANIYALTAILYPEAMLLLLAFGLWPEPVPVNGSAADTVRSRDRVFHVCVGVLVLLALLAVGHQADRYARSEAARRARDLVAPSATAAPTATALAPTATVTPLHEAGPFVVGRVVADGWTIQSVALSDGGIMVALAGPRGRVAFDVTCAASPYRGPFDLGAAHIFYSSDLPADVFRPAGLAVQRMVQQAAVGGAVCDHVAHWRETALAMMPRSRGTK